MQALQWFACLHSWIDMVTQEQVGMKGQYLLV